MHFGLRRARRFLGLPVLGAVQHHRAKFLPVGGARALDPHKPEVLPGLQQRHFAAFLGLDREDFIQKTVEGVAVILGNIQAEALVHQPGALGAEQARPGQVQLPDHPLAVKGHVAHRGEVVEVGISGQQCFLPRAHLPEFFVLHLQFDRVPLQFMDDSPRFQFAPQPALLWLPAPLPRFGAAAQFRAVCRMVVGEGHGLICSRSYGPSRFKPGWNRLKSVGLPVIRP